MNEKKYITIEMFKKYYKQFMKYRDKHNNLILSGKTYEF